MPQLTSQAIFLGGLANTLLAGLRLIGIFHLRDTSRPLAISIDAKRSSLIIVLTRGTFIYLLFAAISFAFPTALASSPLGLALLFGMSGMLALVALEDRFVPEYRRVDTKLTWLFAGTGSLAYLYAALLGI